VPPTLATLVAERLATLDEPARAVLHAAAVLGPELDWRLLAPVTGAAEPQVLGALRAAAEQALLVADGAALRWPHALTRDAVLAVLLPPERAVLAGRAARVLAARAGPDDEPRAAELFAEAGETDAAVSLLLRLARRDTARGALRSAEHLLATAADAAAGTGAAATITAERVTVLTLVGRTADALALGAAGLDLLTGDAHAELCLQLARTAVTAGAWDDVDAYVARAGRPSDPRSLVLRADAAFGAGRGADAVELVAAAITRAEQVADEQGSTTAAAALCEALGVAGRLAWRTDLDLTEALARRAAQVAGEHGLLPWRVAALFQLGMMRMLRAGDMTPMLQSRELALDAGMLGHVAAVDYVRSDHRWTVDGPEAALPIARAAAELVHVLRLPGRAFDADAMVAMVDVLAGVVTGTATPEQARARARALAAGAPGGPRLELVLRAMVALIEHDLPRAATDLETAAHEMRHGAAVTPPLAYLGAYVLVTAAVNGAARVDARTPVATQVPDNRGAFAWADAVVHGRAGRTSEAAALLAEGEAALTTVPWWRRLLHTVVLECAVVDGWGDPVPLLRADLAVHEQEGAVVLARTCRDLLRRAGAPSRRPRAGAAVPPRLRARGITAREAEVLGLVAQGMTNAQIATRLFLSPRTVDTHVANLLAKTGAPTRTRLRSWVDLPR
jgi:DNA-binding CsgD family transcriptional regulator